MVLLTYSSYINTSSLFQWQIISRDVYRILISQVQRGDKAMVGRDMFVFFSLVQSCSASTTEGLQVHCIRHINPPKGQFCIGSHKVHTYFITYINFHSQCIINERMGRLMKCEVARHKTASSPSFYTTSLPNTGCSYCKAPFVEFRILSCCYIIQEVIPHGEH